MKLTDSAKQFLAKTLGDEGLEALEKFHIFKLHANKVIDHEEIRTALMIVPRTVLSLLQKELRQMQPQQAKDVKLPVEPEAILSVTKFENDVYSGNIFRGNKKLAEFKDRSIPGIGLIVMSTFELYDIEELSSPSTAIFEGSDQRFKEPARHSEDTPAPDSKKIQSIIDEKLELRDLIGKVVDQKITEREAIDNFIRMRLTQILSESSASSKKGEK